MKTVNSGDIIKLDGIIYEVVGFTLEKTVILNPLEYNQTIICPHCGKPVDIKERRHEVESCRNFQNGAEKVSTLKDS